MGEVLGVGVSHFPGLKYPDAYMANILRQILESPGLDARLRDVPNWPEAMRLEWGNDEGLQAARRHRQRMVDALRAVRAAIDRFSPDLILIWGDDQYENFREDIIPPFCIYLYDQIATQPFLAGSAITRGRSMVHSVPNVWGEPLDKTWTIKVHRDGGTYLVTRLIESGFDIPYAYEPLHYKGLSHAFMNTLLYLDYDRRGFDVPIIPFALNCYGKDVLASGRNVTSLVSRGEKGHRRDTPPGPTPKRCFEVGAAVRRVLQASPWRAVLVGSSSWSHAFLTRKNGCLYPDMEADRKRYDELQRGQHARWGELSSADIEAAGEHEFRNWICLAGAMVDRKAEVIDYVETYVFNSNKCFAIFH